MKRKELAGIGVWADLLNCQESELLSLAREIPDAGRFRFYMIRKANGGLRMISEPIDSLKRILRELNNIIHRSYEPLDCSHGFVRERSVKTNAEMHVRKNWVYNIDLEKFFPSIPVGRVKKALAENNFEFDIEKKGNNGEAVPTVLSLDPEIVSLLANLCCFRPAEKSADLETLHGLPQGSPTSPVISDMVARDLDLELTEFCAEREIVYTRYADDLSFSPVGGQDYSGYRQLLKGDGRKGNEPSHELLDIIERNGFRLNRKKSRLFSKDSCRVVTGLSVSEFANVPRKIIRSVRADLHLWEKKGYEEANRIIHSRKNYRHRKCPKALKYIISGRLWYISMIRGKGDPVYMRFARKVRTLLDEENAPGEHPPLWYPGKDDELDPGFAVFDFRNTLSFPVIPDDFPRRSARHFADRRRIFLEKRGDLRGMLRTEVGAWAYERIEHIFRLRENLRYEFTYDRLPGEACLLEHILDAEAAYLHLLHDGLMFGQFTRAFSDLFFRIMEINGELCSSKILDTAFRSHVDRTDWGGFFRWVNDEFLSERFSYAHLNADSLVRLASNANLRGDPCTSLMLWTSLSRIARYSSDEEMKSYGTAFDRIMEESANFFPVFDGIFTCCERIANGNPVSMEADELRNGIYFLLKVLGKKPEI